MVAIGAIEDGYREAIGCAEGFTESTERWRDFLSQLKSRGLRDVRMFTGDKAAGMVGSIAESHEASAVKAEAVAADLESIKLKEAAKVVRDGYAETLAYCDRPREHWQRIRTTAQSSSSTGKPSPMPVVARLKYITDSE